MQGNTRLNPRKLQEAFYLIPKCKKRWELTQNQKDAYIEKLTSKLVALRAQANISQQELANMIGVSRQTFYAMENRKRRMSWNTYMSLILVFDTVEETKQMLRDLDAYPTELMQRMQNQKHFNAEEE